MSVCQIRYFDWCVLLGTDWMTYDRRHCMQQIPWRYSNLYIIYTSFAYLQHTIKNVFRNILTSVISLPSLGQTALMNRVISLFIIYAHPKHTMVSTVCLSGATLMMKFNPSMDSSRFSIHKIVLEMSQNVGRLILASMCLWKLCFIPYFSYIALILSFTWISF